MLRRGEFGFRLASIDRSNDFPHPQGSAKTLRRQLTTYAPSAQTLNPHVCRLEVYWDWFDRWLPPA